MLGVNPHSKGAWVKGRRPWSTHGYVPSSHPATLICQPTCRPKVNKVLHHLDCVVRNLLNWQSNKAHIAGLIPVKFVCFLPWIPLGLKCLHECVRTLAHGQIIGALPSNLFPFTRPGFRNFHAQKKKTKKKKTWLGNFNASRPVKI